jgi:methanogenic corrinoid protein MtbC1
MNLREMISLKSSLAEKILNNMYGDVWDDPIRKEKALIDVEWTILFVAQSMMIDSKSLLENFYFWMVELFKKLNFKESDLSLLFTETEKVLAEEFGSTVNDFFGSLDLKGSYAVELLEDNKLEKEMITYRDLVLDGRRNEAKKYIDSLIEVGTPIEDIYILVFQEALRCVGQLWLEGIVSVAVEHYFTAITQYIMSSMYENIFYSNVTKEKRLLACSIGSELHEVGIRMVADLFEINGWDTRYLGASVPINAIVEYAENYNPHAIALSVTMTNHIINLKEVIEQLRENKATKHIKIIVGGRVFNQVPDLYKKVGADLYAVDALEGIKSINEIFK